MMMPNVAQQIIEGAEKEASEILAKNEKEARGIEKAKEVQAKKKADSMLREAEQKALGLKKQMLAAARLSAKHAEVEQKSELIAKVLDEAKKKLSKVPVSEVLPAGASGERLFVSKKDLPWARKNFSGETIEADILGGYILESKGVIRNNSFGVIFDNLRDEYSGKLLKYIKVQKGHKHGRK